MPVKSVKVVVRQGSGFRTECEAGQHKVIIDQPAAAGGTDAGPTPLDYELVALGGCITAVARIIAMQRRISLRGVQVNVEGTINTDRVLGKPSSERAGFSWIRAAVTLDCDLSGPEKGKLLKEIEERCPISDNLANTTPVEITLTA
ncbi:MAG: OsmC family protein [Kiritimatiellia bacterium]